MPLPPTLTDADRQAIHDFALAGRALLVQETRELLEGVYGLYADGRMEPAQRLPLVQADAETAATYRRLAQFLTDETQAGLSRAEAVEKLVKESAFTHLNRLVAFRMMEARKLLRSAVNKGLESNGFKFYLADAAHAVDLARYQQGDGWGAYRNFLLWQAGQIAQEVRVLFDPDALPSRLFPRQNALEELLALLNAPGLDNAWIADETIGWVYQYFNEQEKAAVFDRLYKQKQKIRRQDMAAATQLFTPNWIVRYLVQNTLGRLWVQMHPDTHLRNGPLLDYLVPLPAETQPARLRLVSEIRLLDPACGGMHLGMVAFDLFAAMYAEECERAGEDGWPATPSVSTPDEIPAAILAHNLFGIDIDLRAVQLAALALFLKAKSYNKRAQITRLNLACADVNPLGGAALGEFVAEMRFTRPIYEKLMRALWAKLEDADEVGSLLRLEQEMGELIAAERARYRETPLFAGIGGEFEGDAAEEEFWQLIAVQIEQGLHEFARRQAERGRDLRFFESEAVKGLQLLDIMLNRYDVVVTNPPYSGKRNLNDVLAAYLDTAYPTGKGDLYAAFIQRCAELLEPDGRLGMITQQSFMFLSSYEALRTSLRTRFAIETMAHTGPRAFAEISGEKVNTTVFVLHAEADAGRRNQSEGVYFRLVQAGEGDAKREAFEVALAAMQGAADLPANVYRLSQQRFDAIPGSPWVYRLPEDILHLFETMPLLSSVALPRQGLTTADNTRFIRYWWEVGQKSVIHGCLNRKQAEMLGGTWYPVMKGGQAKRWFGAEIETVNWRNDGAEVKAYIVDRYPYLNGKWEWVAKNPEFYFREGAAYSAVSTGGLYLRWMPDGYICEHASNAIYPDATGWSSIMLTGLFNSNLAQYIVGLNETININIDDLLRMPVFDIDEARKLEPLVTKCILRRMWADTFVEQFERFIVPLRWGEGTLPISSNSRQLDQLEAQLNSEVFHLYGIPPDIRAMIEPTFEPGTINIDNTEDTDTSQEHRFTTDNSDGSDLQIAIYWMAYAVGIILGRFQPGVPGALGRAIYHPNDFAVGSLPAPDPAEFDELVGPAQRFAHIDADGGRHVFPADVELALQALAVPDGITLFDPGHPRDLSMLVDKALRLMLGDAAAQAVIDQTAGGDLRRFLEKDFFSQHHVRWYRKRPIYWPIQSAKRGFGFLVFHEQFDHKTLPVLRNHADDKLRGLDQQIGDLTPELESLTGSARRKHQGALADLHALRDEVHDFAQALERIMRGGYTPAPNWIDDGVILRLAPLWEVLPLWRNEPKKYWERLAAGDFDWAHIALHYWPERVKAKCNENRSFAIAHGLA